MDGGFDWSIVLFFVAGALVLVAEIFVPSHGILGITGLVFFGISIVKAFAQSKFTGGVTVLCGLVFVPALTVVAVKHWPRSYFGRRISPPNRPVTREDIAVDLDVLEPLIGRQGRVLSPLRPAGICDFDGQRIPCLAEMGMIERDTIVKAVGIKGSVLAVVPQPEEATA